MSGVHTGRHHVIGYTIGGNVPYNRSNFQGRVAQPQCPPDRHLVQINGRMLCEINNAQQINTNQQRRCPVTRDSRGIPQPFKDTGGPIPNRNGSWENC
jgi:hypothetical protein